MKKVSELSGVSIATVSRVINNNGRFSRATRERVLAVIRDLGYTPNSNARALRTNKTNTIGVIVPDITNEFFAKLTLYIQQALFEENYSTIIYNTDESKTLEERHIQALTAQSVSGIIFISGGAYSVKIPEVPTIFLDRMPRLKEKNNYIQIRTDHFMGGLQAGGLLARAGCKKPGIVMGPKRLFSQVERLKGFVEAFKREKRDVSIIEIKQVGYDSAYNALSRLLDKGACGDAYFCTTDWIAMGVMNALRERNIEIPGRVKIVGFDNISIAEYSKLTTIHQDIKGMAETASSLMLTILNGGKVDEREYIFDSVLIRRETA
ncbi:MAG: LacI family transcriptional regulator [Treponema sp.]|jgi:LacI family transcriptional regulator|nr:LacI family transcriptional regulator [Treponema sp.]